MKRQIVLLMTDTTRTDMLGCYGNDIMQTPNIDRLATMGIRYENAYTCQPVCGPARSAMFTGLFPHSNGSIANGIALGDNTKTVGQRLHDQGIHCGYIGKWHLDGGDYFGMGRCPDGWDPEYWYDMKCYLDELTDEEKIISRSEKSAYREDMTAEFTFADRCSNRAIDFIEKYQKEDFFLTVSYDEPHDPSLCPVPYNTMYDGVVLNHSKNFEDDLSKKPLMQRVWAGEALSKNSEELNQPSKSLSLFLGCQTFVDYEIGRVLDAIYEKIPDCMVIFTSDHGAMLGNHRLQAKNATAYKEAANVPLIIKGGEVGKTVAYPASHIDLVPTILDYMGKGIPKLLEGKSMLPQIKQVETRVNDNVFLEFTRYEVDHDGFGGLQMMRAIVNERYKLVVHLLDSDELYDTQVDPEEMNNLILDENYSEIRNQLHDQILAHMDETRDPYRGYQWAMRSWRPEKEPSWFNGGYTRQREHEEYEPRQLDYDSGLPMKEAVRTKILNEKRRQDDDTK